MAARRPHSFSDPWLRRSALWLVVLALFAFAVGFVWLPGNAPDFSSQGLWASICRAAGVPGTWGRGNAAPSGVPATDVVLDRRLAAGGPADAIGRGATLALNCTMCHGAQGQSVSDAPNLAGQYPEVIVKQLRDFRSGKRRNALMEALAHGLSERQIVDLAAYYGSLPKPRNQPADSGDVPLLVRDGAPLRNIAPCVTCHGSVDQKLGAPWLEGMPRAYLADQLVRFRSSERGNDSHAQMRNMARAMTNDEIGEVATFYARGRLDGHGQ